MLEEDVRSPKGDFFFFTSLQPKILLKIYKASIELTR